MAQADQEQFLTEWLEGGRGTAAEIVSVIAERFRNDRNTNVGLTLAQADEILTAMDYSDSAKQGLLDIFNALKNNVIQPIDFESAMTLAEGGWPHHTTPAEIRDRVI